MSSAHLQYKDDFIITNNNDSPNKIERPHSPEPYTDIGLNSDDFVPTSDLRADEIESFNREDQQQQQQQQQQEQEDHHHHNNNKLVIIGVYNQRITLGRGGSSTIKIGRRNRQISRTHLAIEYCHGRFELVILGLNGAMVDHLPYKQYERAPLDDHSMVDVLGDKFEFRFPAFPPPSSLNHKSSSSSSSTSSTSLLLSESSDESLDKQSITITTTTNTLVNNHKNQPYMDLPSITKKQNDLDLILNNNNENNNENSVPVEKSSLKQEQENKNNNLPLQQQNNNNNHHLENTSSLKSVKSEKKSSTSSPLSSLSNEKSMKQQIKKKKGLMNNNNKENEMNKENKKENNKEMDKENNNSSHNNDDDENQDDTTDYSELIIDILVFSKKSSMPISDICSRILKTNPQFKKQNREVWNKRIQQVLKEKPFFGEIVRKGKTADGTPKENLYYYNSDMDPVEWRRTTYTQVGRSARKCTLQDKQYFWKIPPKLGKNRNSYIPPPGPPLHQLQDKRKLDQHNNDHDDVNGDDQFIDISNHHQNHNGISSKKQKQHQ